MIMAVAHLGATLDVPASEGRKSVTLKNFFTKPAQYSDGAYLRQGV